MLYSLQRDANGNSFVAKGTVQRGGTYQIIFIGTYAECMAKRGAP